MSEIQQNLMDNILSEIPSERVIPAEDMIKLCLEFSTVSVEHIPFSDTGLKSNAIQLALDFYSKSKEDYKKLISGIENGNIHLDAARNEVSKNGQVFLKTVVNDSSCYKVVHEFAHYLDVTSSNPIYYLYGETLAFLAEHYFSLYLQEKGYFELINTRNNNRLYALKQKALIFLRKVELLQQISRGDNYEISEEEACEILEGCLHLNSSIGYFVGYNLSQIIFERKLSLEEIYHPDREKIRTMYLQYPIKKS